MIVLALLTLACALVLGIAFPGQPEEPAEATRRYNARTGPTLRPGETSVEAVRFLRTLRADPPAPAPPPVELPPAPPPAQPPPDVAVTFKAALSAIRRDVLTGDYVALVRDPAAPVPQTIRMVRGAEFGDGWRIMEISADSVTLRRGRELRVVRLFG